MLPFERSFSDKFSDVEVHAVPGQAGAQSDRWRPGGKVLLMDFKELFNALKDGVKDGLKDAAPKAEAGQASSQDVSRETVIAAYKKYLDARDLSYTYNSAQGTLSMDFTNPPPDVSARPCRPPARYFPAESIWRHCP